MGQKHLAAYYFQTIIFVKIYYKKHNIKLLTVIRTFKNWHYSLKEYKNEILVLINYKKLH